MPKKTVLIVDDEVKFVDAVKAGLEISQYRVLTAADGREGLELARRERPDLIVLDIMMPKVDGFEVLVKLKTDETTRAIPVLMLSARGDSNSLFQSQSMRAADHLIKPCPTEELVSVIRRHIG